LVQAGLVEMFAPALGQLWKLEFAATLPEGDPDLDWIVSVEHPDRSRLCRTGRPRT